MGMTVDEAWDKLRRPFDKKRAEFEQRLFSINERRSDRRQSLRRRSIEQYLRSLANDGITLCRLRAERYVRICYAIWDQARQPRNTTFNQTVFDHCLTPLFVEMSYFVRSRTRSLRPRPSKDQLDVALSTFSKELKDLRTAWKTRLGVVDQEEILNSNDQFGGPYPTLLDGSGGLRQQRSVQVKKNGKPGPDGLPKEFITDAGNLWLEVDRRAKTEGRNVTDEELLTIARALDNASHVPAKKFLIGRARKALATFNSRHSKGEPRPITTWETLVQICHYQKYVQRKSIRVPDGVAPESAYDLLPGSVILDGIRTRLRYCALMLRTSQEARN
jgi:hypothetical protein